VCRHVPFFLANSNLGLKLFGPIWRPAPDVLRGVARGAGRARAHPQTTSALRRVSDRGPRLGANSLRPWASEVAPLFFVFLFLDFAIDDCRSDLARGRAIGSGDS
jgi:hypothetical protein